MSPARDRTRTAGSGDERTNHEATTPPFWRWISRDKSQGFPCHQEIGWGTDISNNIAMALFTLVAWRHKDITERSVFFLMPLCWRCYVAIRSLCEDVHTANVTTWHPSHDVMFTLLCGYVSSVNYAKLITWQWGELTLAHSVRENNILSRSFKFWIKSGVSVSCFD